MRLRLPAANRMMVVSALIGGSDNTIRGTLRGRSEVASTATRTVARFEVCSPEPPPGHATSPETDAAPLSGDGEP